MNKYRESPCSHGLKSYGKDRKQTNEIILFKSIKKELGSLICRLLVGGIGGGQEKRYFGEDD